MGIDNLQNGIVVFSKSRTPDRTFYRRFVKDILIPFVIQERSRANILDSVMSWFVEDGEQVQIDAMRDPDILEQQQRLYKR